MRLTNFFFTAISIIAFTLIINLPIALAQPVNNLVKDVVMPPPNVASLGKYGDIPVSYFTGVPNTGIPIFTVQEGPLSLPVSLSYHASGIKVAETASWVGLGWSLSTGGMVSRAIQGLPDDQSNAGYYWNGDEIVNCADPLSGYQAAAAVAGNLDTEPDLFSFNFGGYSGKFFFDKDKVCQFVPRQDLKFIPLNNNPFEGFTIVTPDGTRYIFGKTSLSTERTAYDYSRSTGEGTGRITTWHLLRIESYDQKFAIDLFYEGEAYSFKSPASCKYIYLPSGCMSSQGQTLDLIQCSTEQGIDYEHRYIHSNVDGKRISKISSSTNIVEFIPSAANREDLEQSQVGGNSFKSLAEIKIYTLTGTAVNNDYCSKYAFSYDYYTDQSHTGSEAKRLRLNQVQRSSCTGTGNMEPPYQFTGLFHK